MPTPTSSATSYCDATTFLKFYDVRSIGDRLGDAGARVASGSVPTDPNLLQALLSASGMVESACLRGNRYTVAALQALTASSAAYLQKLVADLAFWLILQRRPFSREAVPAQCQQALATLDALANGLQVFGLQEEMDAGDAVEVWGPNGKIPKGFTSITVGASRLLGDLTVNSNN